MKRFVLFALVVMVPLACTTKGPTTSGTAKKSVKAPSDTPPDDIGTPKDSEKEIPAKTEDWVQLFNGKDLAGWKKHPEDTKGNWQVVDGVLIGNSPVTSFLYSERGDYQNFHLRMEAKISEKGDSGLFFRSQMPVAGAAKKGPGNPVGYEAQINNATTASGTGTLTGYKSNTKYKINPVTPPDDWFKLEVIAEGPRIRIVLNDEETFDYTAAKDTAGKKDAGGKKGTAGKKDAGGKTPFTQGHFAIQSKAPTADKLGKKGTSESKVIEQIIEVRKLEIKELPPYAGK